MNIVKFTILFLVSFLSGGFIAFAGVLANDEIHYTSFAEVAFPEPKKRLAGPERDMFFSDLKKRIVLTNQSHNAGASTTPNGTTTEDASQQSTESGANLNETEHIAITSNAFVLSVPFTSQAPAGNWSLPWQETCEEATLVMAEHFFNGTPISITDAIAEMSYLVDYQTEIGISYHDTDMKTVAVLGKAIYGLTSEIIDDPTIEQIISRISIGHPVILPTVGQLLGNSNFTYPGPPYHVLILIGYDEARKEFIANDPGTRNGEGYRYSYSTIMNAMHDWNGSLATIHEGDKRVLVMTGLSDAGNSN